MAYEYIALTFDRRGTAIPVRVCDHRQDAFVPIRRRHGATVPADAAEKDVVDSSATSPGRGEGRIPGVRAGGAERPNGVRLHGPAGWDGLPDMPDRRGAHP